jgi:hypothetical protein
VAKRTVGFVGRMTEKGRLLAVSLFESSCSVGEGLAPRVIAPERSLSLTC